jgi:hypothetical protein
MYSQQPPLPQQAPTPSDLPKFEYGTPTVTRRYSLLGSALIFVTVVVILVAALFAIYYFTQAEGQSLKKNGSMPQNNGTSFFESKNTDSDVMNLVDAKTVQAVFLTNDQVYFGRITSITDDTIVLTTVFYPEEQKTGEATDGSATPPPAATNITLKKLGNSEFHQPIDHLVLNREHVLYWQNLRDDSRVTQGIEQYEKQKKEEAEKGENNASSDSNVNSTSETTLETNSNTSTTNANTTNSNNASE